MPNIHSRPALSTATAASAAKTQSSPPQPGKAEASQTVSPASEASTQKIQMLQNGQALENVPLFEAPELNLKQKSDFRQILQNSSLPTSIQDKLLKDLPISREEAQQAYEKLSSKQHTGSSAQQKNNAALIQVFDDLLGETPKVSVIQTDTLGQKYFDSQANITARKALLEHLEQANLPENLKEKLLQGDTLTPEELEKAYQKTSLGKQTSWGEAKESNAVLNSLFDASRDSLEKIGVSFEYLLDRLKTF